MEIYNRCIIPHNSLVSVFAWRVHIETILIVAEVKLSSDKDPHVVECLELLDLAPRVKKLFNCCLGYMVLLNCDSILNRVQILINRDT